MGKFTFWLSYRESDEMDNTTLLKDKATDGRRYGCFSKIAWLFPKITKSGPRFRCTDMPSANLFPLNVNDLAQEIKHGDLDTID